MSTLEDLEARRNAILEEIRAIRSMRRGSITEQFLQVRHQGIRDPVSRGPYYVFSRREGKKTSSQRLSAFEVAQARKDLEEYKRFVTLCREFEVLTERLGELERESPDMERKKKRRNSLSSKRRK